MSQTLEQPAASTSRVALYEDVTARIVRELERGIVPWIKPWKDSGVAIGLPRSAATLRPYSGINILILWDAMLACGFATQEWLTFRQCASLGGHVKKGERGTAIFYAARFVPKKEQERARNRRRTERRSLPEALRRVQCRADGRLALTNRRGAPVSRQCR